MLCVLTLAVLVVATLAQQPHPCQSPRQFEGRFSIFDNDRKFRAFGRMAYDDDNRRFREIEEMEIGRDREYLDRLYLHNLGLEYRMDLKTRQCNVSQLTRPWIPFAVPQDARFRGEGVIGASGVPDEHVTIAMFDGETPDKSYDGQASLYPSRLQTSYCGLGALEDASNLGMSCFQLQDPYFIQTSAEDCVPIQAGFFSNRTGAVLREFYDITLGLRDPDVFIPPKECHSQ